MNISGSVDIEKFVNKKKQIIFVSDIHTDFSKGGCTSYFKKIKYLPEYLQDIILNDKKKTWDFYLEQGINTHKGIPDAEFLDNLDEYYLDNQYKYPEDQEWDLYKNMIKTKKGHLLRLTRHFFNSKGAFLRGRNKIKNCRFHFIDIRQKKIGNCNLKSTILFTRFFHYLRMYLSTVEKWNIEEINLVIDDFIEDLLESINELYKCRKDYKIQKQIKESILSEDIDFFLHKKNKKLYKMLTELYNIWYSNKYDIKFCMIKDLIKFENLESCDFKFTKLKILLNNIYNDTSIIKDLHEIETKYGTNIFVKDKEPPLVSDIIVTFLTNLLDTYALGRMTKEYNNNIIVVAGINHINVYKDFFSKNGWKSEWKSKQKSKKCSRISK